MLDNLYLQLIEFIKPTCALKLAHLQVLLLFLSEGLPIKLNLRLLQSGWLYSNYIHIYIYIIYMWLWYHVDLPAVCQKAVTNNMWKKDLTSRSLRLAGELVGPHTPYFLTDYKSLSWAGKPLGLADFHNARSHHDPIFWCLPSVFWHGLVQVVLFFGSVFCDNCPFSTIPLLMIEPLKRSAIFSFNDINSMCSTCWGWWVMLLQGKLWKIFDPWCGFSLKLQGALEITISLRRCCVQPAHLWKGNGIWLPPSSLSLKIFWKDVCKNFWSMWVLFRCKLMQFCVMLVMWMWNRACENLAKWQGNGY